MSAAKGFILDHSALLALGAGNRLASGLVAASSERADVHVTRAGGPYAGWGLRVVPLPS